MEQLNKLMENPVVQKRIEQQGQQGQNDVMQAHPNSQQTQQQPNFEPEPTNAQTARQQAQGAQSQSEPAAQENTQALDPGDVKTIEVFQSKILNEEGREELVEGLEQLKPYLDEIGGGDATINDIQEHLQSEELQENIEQLREAGLIE